MLNEWMKVETREMKKREASRQTGRQAVALNTEHEAGHWRNEVKIARSAAMTITSHISSPLTGKSYYELREWGARR